MSEASPAPNRFSEYFKDEKARQATRREQLRTGAIACVAAYVVAFFVAAVLGSDVPAWHLTLIVGYVALFIGAGAWRGYKLLDRTSRSIALCLDHLSSLIHDVIDEKRTAEEWLSRYATVGDLSNVPEAVDQFVSLPPSAESGRAAAEACFAHAENSVAMARSVRAYLVLAGLFGTVLFFGLSLGTGALESLDLVQVRYALACTLAGVLAAASLGVGSAELIHDIDQLVTESAAFLISSSSNLRIVSVTRESPDSETKLWAALQLEVHDLVVAIREDSAASRQARVDQNGELTNLVQAVQNLPDIRLPPELANFELRVEQFAKGAHEIDYAIAALVKLVENTQVISPAIVAVELEELRKRVDALAERETSVLDELSASTGKLTAELGKLEGVPERVEAKLVDAVKNEVAGLTSGVERLRTKTGELGSEVTKASAAIVGLDGKVQGLGNKEDAFGSALTGLAASVSRIDRVTGDLRNTTSSIDASQGSLSGQLKELAEQADVSFDGVSGTLLELREVLRASRGDGSEGPARPPSPDAGDLVHRISAVERLLGELRRDVARLRRTAAWVERAESAPLMRLLTLPLWERGRVPFTFPGSKHE